MPSTSCNSSTCEGLQKKSQPLCSSFREFVIDWYHPSRASVSRLKLAATPRSGSLRMATTSVTIFHSSIERSRPIGCARNYNAKHKIRKGAPETIMSIQSINPATEETIQVFASYSDEQVNEALDAAYNAFWSWRETSFAERSTHLH